MEYLLSNNQKELLISLRTFLRKEEVEEKNRAFEQDEPLLTNLFLKFAGEGFLGIPFASKHGGSEGGVIEAVITLEELARSSFPLVLEVATSWMFGGNIINIAGNEKQKEAYLPKIVQGQLRTSMALTEPEAGSDAASVKTIARREENHFIIDGQKTFISGANKANIIIVVARTDETVPKQEGISMFVVDSCTPGIEMTKLQTLGRRTLSTFHIFFDKVQIPEENMLGKLNEGWKNLLKILAKERIFSAAMSTGGSQAVLDTLIRFVKEKKVAGTSLSKFQSIGHKIADISIAVTAAKLLTYDAAYEADHQSSLDSIKPSMAKTFAGENWIRASQEGMEIMGTFGYLPEYDMERFLRDARLATIAGGTAEIQRNIIARGLGL